MKYNIAICDDVRSDSDYTKSLVRSWAELSEYTVNIDSYSSAEAFLFAYEENKQYDILIFDIEMEGINGVELAKKVRENNREVPIIFITGFDDYISDGYDVEALHYILKPVDRDKLNKVLDRACEKLRKNEQAIFFDLPDGMVRIPLYEIRYIEVRSNYITVHGVTEISAKTTLSAVEKELDSGFFRVGRSFIVNMRYIRKITKTEVILEGGVSVPLSRGLYEPLNRAFINHF